MTEILSRLGQLFVQTVPTVIFVFLLLAILERWFFRPLTAVLKQRDEATAGALACARQQADQAEAKSREYEAALQATRQEIYRLREEERRAALKEREDVLTHARQQAESRLRAAQAQLAKQIEEAQKELERASQSLALRITDVILGDGVSTSREGEG